VEEDALVDLGDAEDLAGLVRAEPLHVAQGDHDPLVHREHLQRAIDALQSVSPGGEPLRGLLPRTQGGLAPGTLLVEALRIDHRARGQE
jgi:hypothetical protein